jgi:hypothetical protein
MKLTESKTKLKRTFKMKTILAVLMVLAASPAFANTAIECGTDVNFDDGVVGQRAFLLSSEDDETFKAYNSANEQIKNVKIKKQADGSITMLAVKDQGIGGPVGIKFVIEAYSGENFTVANKFAVGGFAGGTKVGKLDCTVIEM